ncbi:MAG: MBL fold metallo-hydrolase [Candidatus Eremiobacterota bacterium]
MFQLQFLGAAGTVTGSKYLITWKGRRILLDCGLFQGAKEIRQRNWEELPVDPASVEAMVMTHAHIDHSGYLPRFCRDGFKGKVHATHGTCELCSLLLPDSAHLQEEQAYYVNKERVTRHKPALPLYTVVDAQSCLRRFAGHDYHDPFEVLPGLTACFHDAGHILGSAWVELTFDGRHKVVFSGDLGRKDAPILRDPEALVDCEYLVLESTYGDRLHGDHPIEQNLRDAIWETIRQRGVMVVPAFAVERAQEILYIVREIRNQGEIPELPIFIDSPMAAKATRIFEEFPEYFDEEATEIVRAGGKLLDYPYLKLCDTVEQSKAISGSRPPFIVISASGMATGGRVLHHLKNYLPDARNMVLLVGFQSVGSRGWQLQEGQDRIKIFGQWVPVRAHVRKLDGFSGHADYEQINHWLRSLQRPPRKVFLTHGEPTALEAQRVRLSAWPGWDVHVPAHCEEVALELGLVTR